MIRYSEACKVMQHLSSTIEWQSETINLEDAFGRFASEDVKSLDCHPRISNSAMDGFAIKSSSTIGASDKNPIVFSILGTKFAGSNLDHNHSSKTSQGNQNLAFEVMTGAPLPENGFDSIIPFEHVIKLDGNKFAITSEIEAGTYLRHKGEDFKPREILCTKGKLIDHKTMMLIAAGGIPKIEVYKKMSACIFATGDEIVDFRCQKMDASQVRNVTSIYLQSSLQNYLNFKVSQHLKDCPDGFKKLLSQAFADGVEIVVTTGGVSMGRADFVKETLLEMGAEILFHKVAIKPGKPILLSTLLYNGKKKIILSCPGNPLSTLVATECFLKIILQSSLKENSNDKKNIKGDDYRLDGKFKDISCEISQKKIEKQHVKRNSTLGARDASKYNASNSADFFPSAASDHRIGESHDPCCHEMPDIKVSPAKLEQNSALQITQKKKVKDNDFLFEKSLLLPLIKDFKKPKGLLCFYKARTIRSSGMTYIDILPDQASHRLASLDKTEGLVILPEDVEIAEAGQIVEFIIFD